MNIGFSCINVGLLASERRGVGRFDCERERAFRLPQVRLCDFAVAQLFFLCHHFFLSNEQTRISEIKFEVNQTQRALLGL